MLGTFVFFKRICPKERLNRFSTTFFIYVVLRVTHHRLVCMNHFYYFVTKL